MPLPLIHRPSGSPDCWGQAYEDLDRECRVCKHNDTCRGEFLHRQASRPGIPQQPPPPTYGQLPMYPQYPQYPAATTAAAPARINPSPYQSPYQQQQPPPPQPRSSFQPTGGQQQPQQVPTFRYSTPTQPQQYGAPMVQYQPQAPMVPRPLDPHAHLIGQYPGESVGQRIAKNLVLRMVEALFGELWRFFHVWTWPKHPDNQG